MRFALVVVTLAACGRIGFESAPADFADGAVALCGGSSTAPATIHITGQTFRYVSYDNDRTPLVGTTIAAGPTIGSTAYGMTTSAADGSYDLAIDTGGSSLPVVARYTLGGNFTTDVIYDRPVDRDVIAPGGEALTLGDGPIWNVGQMDSLYGLAGLARNPARAFIIVDARDCAGAPVDGAVVDIQPAPEAIVYQANDGLLVANGTETQTRFGHALGLNAVGGATLITVTHPTRAFQPISVEVTPGDVNTLVVARTMD